MLAKIEREKALSALEAALLEISTQYRECYLSQGRGALLVYADSVINGHMPSASSYRTKKDILDIFDDKYSKAELRDLIKKYTPKTEGILVLITSINNETSFITVKLKPQPLKSV